MICLFSPLPYTIIRFILNWGLSGRGLLYMPQKNLSLTSRIALGVFFSLALTTAIPALADGMPNEEPKPAPTILDKALIEIHGEATEEPVQVVKEAPAETPVIEEPQKVADEKPAPAPENRVVEVQPNSSFFGLSVGLYDITHGNHDPALNLEFQPGVKIAGILQPIFGAMMTNNGTVFGYAGAGVPVSITDHFFIMPSLAAGLYREGDGYDLGRNLAFRVGTEIGWQFDNKSRIGLNLHAITNGTSFDRADRTEVISVVYTTPLATLKKGL